MKIQIKHGVYFMALLSVVLASSLAINPSEVLAAPTTFTVTNTNDSGVGSFRQAIEDANNNSNASEMDTIEFDIPSSQVHTILLDTSLPIITQKVTIDGYTQTGAQENTIVAPEPLNSVLKIEIDCSGLESGLDCIRLEGDTDEVDGSVVRGLAVIGGANDAVKVNGQDISIVGNYIGTDATGLTVQSSTSPLAGPRGLVTGGSTSDLVVGGLEPADRNILVGLNGPGSGGQVFGNYIGIGKDGETDLNSQMLVLSSGSDDMVFGSSQTGGTNLVSGGSAVQFTLYATSRATIQGNYIGSDSQGVTNQAISNGAGIIILPGGDDNLIGGTGAGEGNTVRGIGGVGISTMAVDADDNHVIDIATQKNSILGNTIADMGLWEYFNGDFGSTDLAIDHVTGIGFPPETFTDQGPTPNDPGDSDTGPNNWMNTPVLKSAQQVGNQLTIHYDLDAADASDGDYRVEFFANDTSTVFGAGPAQEFIGAVTAQNGTDHTATFTVSGDYTNKALSATTTAIDVETWSGYGATSELAKNISVGSATDFDSDGSTDDVEALGPNGGDANNDGTPDSEQPTVTTYEIDSTGKYATFITEGCSENGTVASIDISSLPEQDGNYEYPYGLTDFTLNCSRGDTVTVTKYIWDDVTPDNFVVRKYNPETNEYREIEGSTITTETVAGTTGLKLSYQITDGGDYDDDATANGIIVDPVGVATLAASTGNSGSGNSAGGAGVSNSNGNGNLANTGQNIQPILIVGALLISTGLLLWRLSRRHSYKIN